MEDLLKMILAGQENMQKQLTNLANDVQSVKDDVQSVKDDVQSVKMDIQAVKEGVHRIESHQEDTIMGMLSHIKKQVELKESQIQVLNKRLFEVESKIEQVQQ